MKWSDEARRQLNDQFVACYNRRLKTDPVHVNQVSNEIIGLMDQRQAPIALAVALPRYIRKDYLPRNPAILEGMKAWVTLEMNKMENREMMLPVLDTEEADTRKDEKRKGKYRDSETYSAKDSDEPENASDNDLREVAMHNNDVLDDNNSEDESKKSSSGSLLSVGELAIN